MRYGTFFIGGRILLRRGVRGGPPLAVLRQVPGERAGVQKRRPVPPPVRSEERLVGPVEQVPAPPRRPGPPPASSASAATGPDRRGARAAEGSLRRAARRSTGRRAACRRRRRAGTKGG